MATLKHTDEQLAAQVKVLMEANPTITRNELRMKLSIQLPRLNSLQEQGLVTLPRKLTAREVGLRAKQNSGMSNPNLRSKGGK